VRWSLLKAPEKQSVRQLAKLHEVQQTNKRMYRAFLLFNELRWLNTVRHARADPCKSTKAGLRTWRSTSTPSPWPSASAGPQRPLP
jgi:hypothetical protein